MHVVVNDVRIVINYFIIGEILISPFLTSCKCNCNSGIKK